MSSDELIDRDIRQRVWGGSVPILIHLADNEVTTLEKPRPFFISLPRVSYLTLVCDPVKEFFAGFAPTITDEIWFESPAGLPLKWHIPIGVLFDLLSNGELPLSLTLHFERFPKDQLLRCPEGPGTVRAHFTNQLKESTHVKYGDIKKWIELPSKDSTQLWEGITQVKFEKFWEVHAKLNQGPITRVPVRICRQDKPFVQYPAPVKDASGEPVTLEALLRQQVPEYFSTEKRCSVLIHGIDPGMEAPLEWLALNMSHPDGFLYIIILPHA